MSVVVDSLLGIDLASTYKIIEDISTFVATVLSPVLLIIAIYTRTMETQLDGLVSGGKWAAALRDMVGWGVVLGLYAAIGFYIIDFMNAVTAWSESIGSLSTITKSYSAVMQKWSDKLVMSDINIVSLLASPAVLFYGLTYYVTQVLVTFVALFLKIANVLVFGVAYIWGLIAIPISISTTFRILRGWALLMGFALLWPFITALFIALFSAPFTDFAETIAITPGLNAAAALSNIYLLFSILHLLLIAVLIAAPFVAQGLVANTASAAGIVTPFVGAALAAGALTAKASTMAGEKVGGGIASRLGKMLESTKPAATTPMSRASASRPASSLNSAQSESAMASDSVDSSATPVPATPQQPDSAGGSSKSRRNQRNAIIRQNLKKR